LVFVNSDDGQRFLSTSYDRRVKLWDTETGACISDFSNKKMAFCVRFYPLDNNIFMTGSSNNSVIQVRGAAAGAAADGAACERGAASHDRDGTSHGGGNVCFGGLRCPHGGRCVRGIVIADVLWCTACQWDIRTGEIALEYQYHLGQVNTITFADEGRRFVSTAVSVVAAL
jgi:WD40 repeat protein